MQAQEHWATTPRNPENVKHQPGKTKSPPTASPPRAANPSKAPAAPDKPATQQASLF